MPAYNLDGKEINSLLAITQEEAERRIKWVTPLIRKGFKKEDPNSRKLHTFEIPDLFNTAFNWDPKIGELVDANELQLCSAIHTYHRCGYHGVLKFSLAEVLAQLPAWVFHPESTNMYFETLLEDPVVQIIGNDKDFYGHKAVTLIYSKYDY